MDDQSQNRTSTRLRLQGGNVVVRVGERTPLQCSLTDLSEGGCQCVALLAALGAEAAEEWKTVIVKDQILALEIDTPPYLHKFEVEADVRHVQLGGGGAIQFGMRFQELSESQLQMLQKAILTFAMEKVRGVAGGGEKSSTKTVIGGSRSKRNVEAPVPAAPAPVPVPPAPKPKVSERKAPVEERVSTTRETVALRSTSERKPKEAPDTAAPEPSSPESSADDFSTYESQMRNSMAQAAADKNSFTFLKHNQQFDSKAKPNVPSDDQPSPSPTPVPPPPPSRIARKPLKPFIKPSVPSTSTFKKTVAQLSPQPPARAQVMGPLRKLKLGELLVHLNKITTQQVEGALTRASASGERLGRFLLRKGLISPQDLCHALALQSGLPITVLSEIALPRELIELFPFELMSKHLFIPFDDTKKMVFLAAANTLYPEVLAELEHVCQRRVEIFLTDEDMLLKHLDDARPLESKIARNHSRYEVEMDVKYRFCNRLRRVLDPIVYDGKTVDFSDGGFMIIGPQPNPNASEVIRQRGACLEVRIYSSGQQAEILCGLAFSKIDVDNDLPWQFGLKVLEADEAGRVLLDEIRAAAGKNYNFHF